MKRYSLPWHCAGAGYTLGSDIHNKVNTTDLACGLLCPYKGAFPNLRPEGAPKSAYCTTFTAALKRALSVLPYSGPALKGLLVCFGSLLTLKSFISCVSPPAGP